VAINIDLLFEALPDDIGTEADLELV